MEIIYNVISFAILYFVSYSNISFLLCKKSKLLLMLVGMIFFSLSFLIDSPIRIIYYFIILIFVFNFTSRDLKKTISAIIFNYFSMMVVETTVFILLVSIGKYNYSVTYIFSIIISFLSYFVIRRKIFLQLWNIIQNKFEKYVYFLLIVVLIFIYINTGYRYNFINLSVLVVFILVLIFIIIKELVQSYITKLEIEKMLEYIKTYEKQLNELMINQHEYKNTLLCIKAMIPTNQKAKDFIDSVLMDKSSKDYDILKDVLKVQISPIRGLIYHKLLICKEKKIHSVLNVSSGINFKNINMIDIITLRDITIILGVLLDNAIDACLETKQKSLSIYLYEENSKFIIQISNTFKGIINIDLLGKTGYSTKGKNRGYGLSLARKKVNENNRLSMKSEICDDVFIQCLQIDLKHKKNKY